MGSFHHASRWKKLHPIFKVFGLTLNSPYKSQSEGWVACLHKESSNIFEVTQSSNAKERAIKIEVRNKYLPNYGKYSDKLARDLPWSERPCAKFCSKTVLKIV